MKKMNVLSVIIFGMLSFFAVSCSANKTIASIEEDELFTLKYGNFEDELNMFDLATVGNINTTMAMRDGFFYIANGESKKIMELNSYGDLLTLFYNEETNPRPTFLSEDGDASATRKAVSYPFNEISLAAVDNRKYLYVVDRLPRERQEMDENSNQVLSQIVLRFDGNGNFVDYLGQQGPGGTPFPYISAIYLTENSELVVVSKRVSGVIIFWFAKDGKLLYTVPLENKNVPNPYKAEKPDSWFTMENVVPDLNVKKLYVKADYYSSYVDEASRVQSGITFDGSLLYTLDIETGSYSTPMNVLAYREHFAEGFSKESYEIPYDFLGVTDNNWFFFIVSTESGFSIQMMQSDGQRILQRRIPMNHKQNLFYTFSLSSGGILSVLRVQQDEAIIDWWRTDELIQSVLKS